MADDAQPTAAPILVPVKVAPPIANEGLRVIVLGVLAIAADRFVRNGLLLPTVMAGAGFLATWIVGVLQHLETTRLFRKLNALLPDHLAKAKP